MDLEKFLWKVRSTAFQADGEVPVHKRGRKPSALEKRIDALSDGQKRVLLLLLSSKAALVTVASKSYAVRKLTDRWAVVGLTPSSEEHTVREDLAACSCEDNKFRKRECKHILALKEFLRGQS